MRSDVEDIRWTKSSRARSFMVVLVCWLLPALSIAGDYWSELEAEAKSSADTPSVRSGAIGSPKHKPAGRVSFERVLELEKPHVYTFYRRLSDAEKRQVVTQYIKDAENISKAANQVLNLYFQKK